MTKTLNQIIFFPLNEVGLGYIFQNQVGYFDKNMIKQILRDQFIQKWHSDIDNSSRGKFYSGFKNDFCLENYLLRLNEYNRKWITKSRTSTLRLPIETGRWYNIPREDRKCIFLWEWDWGWISYSVLMWK